MQSHHDILISQCKIPEPITENPLDQPLPVAPKIENTRVKIKWTDDGISAYQEILGQNLDQLADRWLDNDSATSISVLFATANAILDLAARSSNKFIDLSKTFKPKSKPNHDLLNLRKNVIDAHKAKKNLEHMQPCNEKNIEIATENLRQARSTYSRALRRVQHETETKLDLDLMNDLAQQPNVVYKSIKNKHAARSSVSTLKVGDKVFSDKLVPDGFFMSLSDLKQPDMSAIYQSAEYCETLSDYRNIMELVKIGEAVPNIQPHESIEILYSLKSDVNDLFSITACHFINAGAAGLRHFHRLMTSVITNLRNANMEELNDIWAVILYIKKDKESHAPAPFLLRPLIYT